MSVGPWKQAGDPSAGVGFPPKFVRVVLMWPTSIFGTTGVLLVK